MGHDLSIMPVIPVNVASMAANYLTLIDTDGRLAKIVPFDPTQKSYADLEGIPLGSTAMTEEDRATLLRAYGETLVDGTRVHCTFHWREDRGQTNLEVDLMKFPPINATALVLVEIKPRVDRPELSRRELSVLKMSAEDRTDAEVARALRITKTTVSRHKQNIRAKLGFREWAAADAWAVQNKLV